MPHDAITFIGIALAELVVIVAILQATSRLWPRIAGAFLVAFTAAIARNAFFGPAVNRETVMMALIHAATVTVVITLIFLIRWKRRK